MKIRQCLPYDPRFINAIKLTKNQRKTYECYGACGSIINEVARMLRQDPGQVSKTVRAVQRRALEHFGELQIDDLGEIEQRRLKLLFLDIETMYHVVALFDLKNVKYVGDSQVIEYGGRLISWAAKWVGTEDSEIIYEEARGKSDKKLVASLCKLMAEADVVCCHNANFDIKSVRARALKHGIDFPNVQSLCTLQISRRQLRLPRHTLKFLAKHLGLPEEKGSHSEYPGMELWRAVARREPEAFKILKEYNIQDVITLEACWNSLRQFSGVNLGVLAQDTVPVCPSCASTNVRRTTPIATPGGMLYDGWRCLNCRGFSRGRKTILEPNNRTNILSKVR